MVKKALHKEKTLTNKWKGEYEKMNVKRRSIPMKNRDLQQSSIWRHCGLFWLG